jgi:hypothetical protein
VTTVTKSDVQTLPLPVFIVLFPSSFCLDDIAQIGSHGAQNRLGQNTKFFLSHLPDLPSSFALHYSFSENSTPNIWFQNGEQGVYHFSGDPTITTIPLYFHVIVPALKFRFLKPRLKHFNLS